MAIARVQDTGIQTGANVSSDSASLGTVTAGNLLAIAVGMWRSAGPSISGVADGIGNTFSQADLTSAFFAGTARAALWYKENCSGGSSTPVITFGASATYTAWAAIEFSGVATSSSLDQSTTATGSSAAADANVTSGATTQADELVLAVASVARSGDSDVTWGSAATTGYTNIAKYADWAGIETISFDYKVVAATGAQSANWSHDNVGTGNDSWGAVIATFKAVLAGITYPRLERSVRGALRGMPGRA